MRKEILVAFSAPGAGALGNIWRITAKKTDFYLDPLDDSQVFHFSVHGPNDRDADGHRFHVKVDRQAATAARDLGQFVIHSVARRGNVIDGQELAPGVFRVARIRWLWDLQRPRFRTAAYGGALPEVLDDQSGVRLGTPLPPNEAADIDLIVSYGEPYWPHALDSLRDNSRLGPLRNDAGMWLTATSYRRSRMKYPEPDGLVLPLPKPDEEPARILGGGPGQADSAGIYWFVEGITSRQLIDASRPASPPLIE